MSSVKPCQVVSGNVSGEWKLEMYLDQGVKVPWQVVSGNFLVTRIRKREEQIYRTHIESCLPLPDTVWRGTLSLITVGESVIRLDGTYKRSRYRSR